VSVLIPAAGSGQRPGLGPNALLAMAGRPLLDWAVDQALPRGALRVEVGATGQQSVGRLGTGAAPLVRRCGTGPARSPRWSSRAACRRRLQRNIKLTTPDDWLLAQALHQRLRGGSVRLRSSCRDCGRCAGAVG
jgi:hypothetical protein